MENYSSEVEIAIKIGEVRLTGRYTGEMGDVKDFKEALIKLGVNLERDPVNNYMLSNGLRALTQHRGDVSYERFLQSINWEHAHEVKCAAAFLLGIGYIYPPSSMFYNGKCLVFNAYLPDGFNNATDIIDLYINARNLYYKGKQMEEDYKANKAKESV